MSSSVRIRSISTRSLNISTRTRNALPLLRQQQHQQQQLQLQELRRSMYTLTTSPASIGCSIGYGGASENPLSLARRYRGSRPVTPSSTRSNSTSSSSSSASKGNTNTIDFSALAKLYPKSKRTGEHDLWYVLTATCLIAWRREAAVADLWSYISSISTDDEHLIKQARRLREGLLKASVLVGFPRAINGLAHLTRSIKEHNSSLALKLSDDAGLRVPVSEQVKHSRGESFFRVLYDKHADLVLANMSATSAGDLSYFALQSVYGELMAETSILDAADTGLLEFACCIVGGCADQAKGHMYGSRNLGAKGEEVRGVIHLVKDMARILHFPEIDEYLAEMPFLEKANDWE